jgi:hypothetical protein
VGYDEDLADGIRSVMGDRDGVTEKKMFGQLAFLVHGNMAVAASDQSGLLLRVDPGETDMWVQEDGVTRFVLRGRAMDGWVHVSPPAASTDHALSRWAAVGVACTGSLPSK